MKKQLFATIIGLGIAMPGWSYLGPDDKKALLTIHLKVQIVVLQQPNSR